MQVVEFEERITSTWEKCRRQRNKEEGEKTQEDEEVESNEEVGKYL